MAGAGTYILLEQPFLSFSLGSCRSLVRFALPPFCSEMDLIAMLDEETEYLGEVYCTEPSTLF
ncbi:MAG: hypothetical protein AAFN50_14365, partial [Pseudomonadota bacterium]